MSITSFIFYWLLIFHSVKSSDTEPTNSVIIVDPQEEFISNRGLYRHSHADLLAEELADYAVEKLEQNSNVFITAAMLPPQDCSFLTRSHLNDKRVREWFFGKEISPLSFVYYGNKQVLGSTSSFTSFMPKKADKGVQGIDILGLHPTCSFRYAYFRQEYNTCDSLHKCITDFDKFGNAKTRVDRSVILSSAPKCEPVPDECPELNVPLFPPNRVMAPGGGGAISSIFLSRLGSQIKVKHLQDKLKNLYFFLRGFGNLDASFSSLFESSTQRPPSWTEFASTDPGTCLFPFTALGDDGSVLCKDYSETLPLKPLNSEFISIVGNEINNWRETVGSSDEKISNFNEFYGITSDQQDIQPNFEQGYLANLESEKKATNVLLQSKKWRYFSPRVSYPHMCPTRLGPIPSLIHSLCRTGLQEKIKGETKPTFDELIKKSTSVEIAGFFLDLTVQNTAIKIKKSIEKMKVTVKSNLSPTFFNIGFNDKEIKIPEGLEKVLPKKVSARSVLDKLAHIGVHIDHSESFTFSGQFYNGWFDSSQASASYHAALPENITKVENKASSKSSPKSLSVMTWNTQASKSNPFEYQIPWDNANYNSIMEKVKEKMKLIIKDKTIAINKILVDSAWNDLSISLPKCGFDKTEISNIHENVWKKFIDGSLYNDFLIQLSSDNNLSLLLKKTDRITSSIILSLEKVEHRPAATTCSRSFTSKSDWWAKWNKYMFESTVKSVKSPCKSLFTGNGKVDRPSLEVGQGIIYLAIFDSLLIDIIEKESLLKEFSDVQLLICATQSLKNRADGITAIIETKHAPKNDVIILGDATAFLLNKVQKSKLKHDYFIMPSKPLSSSSKNGFKDTGNVVLVKKSIFNGGQTDLTKNLLALIGPDMGIDSSDLFAVVVKDNFKSIYLIVCVTTEKKTFDINKFFDSVLTLQEKHPGQLILSISANGIEKTNIIIERISSVKSNFVSSFSGGYKTKKTINFDKTFMQLEWENLNHQVGVEDHILAQPTQFTISESDTKISTTQDDPTDNFPTILFPSAHAIVETVLKVKKAEK